MMIATILIAIIITIICLYFYLDYRKYPPGPWGLPIIGHLHKLDTNTPNVSFLQLAQKYGPLYSMKLGSLNTVVIAEANLLRKILMKNESLARPPLYMFDVMFGNKGITCCSLDTWKSQRKLVNDFLRKAGAAKTAGNRRTLEELITKSAEEFIQHVRNEGKRTILNPSEAVRHYVAVIANTLFLGTSLSYDDKLQKDAVQSLDKATELATVSGILNFFPFLRFVPKYRKMDKYFKQLMKTIYNAQNEFLNKKMSLSKITNKTSILNFVDTFLAEKSKNQNDEIDNLEELGKFLFDLLGATFETTKNSILWIMLYLAQYQEVQSKVRQELFNVLQGNSPQMDDLAILSYTEATIAEVSRIRTVLPLGFPRYASGDIHIQDMKIRKGTVILPLQWAIHMDPKVWKMPEEFRPERFLDDEGKFFQHESFVPFQAGKRMCVGKDLANMIVFLFVATVLQKVKIECDGPDSVDLHIHVVYRYSLNRKN